MSSLLEMLRTDPEYRLTYVRYKVQVEHRKPPKELLQDLPVQISLELERMYDTEIVKWLRKHKKHDPTE